MGTGIVICGLNGSGKSTLGKALAEKQNFHFIDIVLIDVPKEIRMERVKKRSFQKFGDRMLHGGDLYEQEESFFHLVESRAENTVEEWLKTQNCPVIRVDGTKAVEENVNLILSNLRCGAE